MLDEYEFGLTYVLCTLLIVCSQIILYEREFMLMLMVYMNCG